MSFVDNYQDTVLIVAHPDDEILWFSSIVERVHKIIICYETVPSNSTWTQGRISALKEFPLDNIINLGLTESECFWEVDWGNPKLTDQGIEVQTDCPGSSKYHSNFIELLEKLKPIIKNYQHVVSHNPWGEYGHSEHIQVFRVLQQLQRENEYSLWYSSCASNKTIELANNYITSFRNQYFSLPANISMAESVKALYQKHQCWTWYDDYVWFAEDFFIEYQKREESLKTHGSLCPINYVKVEKNPPEPTNQHQKRNISSKVSAKLKKLFKS